MTHKKIATTPKLQPKREQVNATKPALIKTSTNEGKHEETLKKMCLDAIEIVNDPNAPRNQILQAGNVLKVLSSYLCNMIDEATSTTQKKPVNHNQATYNKTHMVPKNTGKPSFAQIVAPRPTKQSKDQVYVH